MTTEYVKYFLTVVKVTKELSERTIILLCVHRTFLNCLGTERTIGHGINIGSYEYIGLILSVLGQKGQ